MNTETIFIVVSTTAEEKRLFSIASRCNVKVSYVGGDFAISGTKQNVRKFQQAWYG